MSTTTTATTRHAVATSPIGQLTIVRDTDGLTGVYFPGHWTRPDRSGFGPEIDADDDPVLTDTVHQLDEYFAGRRTAFDLPLAPGTNEITARVREVLVQIPCGRTTTYGALAAQLGDAVTARDAGALVGQNPLSIIVPCHRVVGSTGSLTGYAGGLARKRFLLELEGAMPAGLW